MSGVEAPAWMLKHPCEACGSGYGICSQFLATNHMCCAGCSHPGRWAENPYTAADYREMWAGREADMPEAVRRLTEPTP